MSITLVTGAYSGPYVRSYGTSTQRFGTSEVIEAAGEVKYFKFIQNYDENGSYHDSLVYTMTEDKKETLNMTASHEFTEYNNSYVCTHTLWKYEDGRSKEWYYNPDPYSYYFVSKDADGNILQENGTKPE